jgi:hypothetical protein
MLLPNNLKHPRGLGIAGSLQGKPALSMAVGVAKMTRWICTNKDLIPSIFIETSQDSFVKADINPFKIVGNFFGMIA